MVKPAHTGATSRRLVAAVWAVALGFAAIAHGQSPDEGSIAPYLITAPNPRFALIVGVSHYDAQSQVVSAQADVDRLRTAFKNAGFDVVAPVVDPDHTAWISAVKSFAQYIRTRAPDGGAHAVVYFAAHGMKDDAHQGYLLPRDFDGSKHPIDSAVTIEWVMEELDTHEVALRFAFVDTCRTYYDPVEPARVPAGKTIDVNVQGFAGAEVVFSTQGNRPSYSPTTDGEPSHFANAVVKLLDKDDKELTDAVNELVKDVFDATSGPHQQVPLRLGGVGTASFRPGQRMHRNHTELWHETLMTDDLCAIDHFTRLYAKWVTYPGMARWRRENASRLSGCSNQATSRMAAIASVEALPTSSERPVMAARIGQALALYDQPSEVARKVQGVAAQTAVIAQDLGKGWAHVFKDGRSLGFARWNPERLPAGATPAHWQLQDARPVENQAFAAAFPNWEATAFGVEGTGGTCEGGRDDRALLTCLAGRQRALQIVRTTTVDKLCGARADPCLAIDQWAGLDDGKPTELRIVSVAADSADPVAAFEQAFEDGLAVRVAIQARKAPEDDVTLTVQPASWAKGGSPEDAAMIGQVTLRSEEPLPKAELQELLQ